MQQDSQPAAANETDRVRALYDRIAHGYDSVIAVAEGLLFRGGRQWICAQAAGRVLEVGIGTGRNVPCYRPDVRLTGVELIPVMLSRAAARAQALHRTVGRHARFTPHPEQWRPYDGLAYQPN